MTASTGHHASLSVVLVPVESLSRPRQGESAKFHLQVTKHDASIESSDSHLIMVWQFGCDDGAQTPFSTMVITPNIQSPVGFLASPSQQPDNVCNVPHRQAFKQNGITSHANRTPDKRHATLCALQYYRLQTASSTVASPLFVKKERSPFDTHDQV